MIIETEISARDLQNPLQKFQQRLTDVAPNKCLRVIVSDAKMAVAVVKATREWCRQCGGRVTIKCKGLRVYIRKERQNSSWHPWMERKIVL